MVIVMKKLLHGVGIYDTYLKNTKPSKSNLNQCAFYDRWRHMIERCYSEKYLIKKPTYAGCTVCDEWLTFSNFKGWMEKQKWEGKHLDKDIICRGNKIYSPEFCAFITPSLNNFITERANSRGEWPLGVSWNKQARKLEARCSNPFTGKQERIGYFTCPETAHLAWKNRKRELAFDLSKLQDDHRVSAALMIRYE